MKNFEYKGVVGGAEPENRDFNVVAGTVGSIVDGDLVVIADGYAVKVADGGAPAGNGLYGLARSISTETASVNGTVNVDFSPTGLIVQGIATTPANLATAVLFDKVSVDVSGTTQTIDENAAGALLLYKFIGDDYTTTGLIQVVIPFNLSS